MKLTRALVASLLLATVAFAQPRPPGGPEGGGPPPRDRDRGPGPGQGPRDHAPGGMDERPAPLHGTGMSSADRMARFELMRGYLDAVGRYAQLARDPANSGIAAVVSAADILRPRGADVAIDYFNKLLPEVKTPAVQRAIRIQLVDLYKAAGKQDEALNQLKELMTADTSNEPTLPPPPPQPPRP